MRISVAMAVACLAITSLSAHEIAAAGIKRDTNITAQGLNTALAHFAKDRDLQLVYASKEVDGLRTSGAVGELTADEALNQLLDGTGLSYKYLDDDAITVYPTDATTTSDESGHGAGQREDERGGEQISAGGKGETFWRRFRLAQAQPPASTSSSGASNTDSESSLALEEVIVTAQKREERLQDVPIAISVVSGEALDRSTSQGISEELNRVPGVAIPPISQSAASQIALRGVSAASGAVAGSSPIGYYLDNVPFGFVRSAFIPDASAFDLQRVEVVRGPQGTLYGANSENGVVRVITNDADLDGFDLKARAIGSATDDGGSNGVSDVAVNVPLVEGKLAVRGVVGYQDWSGWIDRPADRDANDGTLRNFRFKANFQPTERLSIGFSYWGSRNHYGAPPMSLSNRTAPDSGISAEPVDADFDVYATRISFEFAHFSVSSVTSWLDYSSLSATDLTPYGGPFYTGENVRVYLSSRVLSQELLLNSTDTGSWTWTAGVAYRDNKDRWSQVIVPCDCGVFDFADHSRSYAVFGQINRRFLGDKLEWGLGLRQFRDEVSTTKQDPTPPPYFLSDTFNATTPRAVLSWYPDSRLTAYASFSQGFRSGVPQYYATGNLLPNAEPDKLYNYEVGAKSDLLDHRLAVDISAYYIKWKDVQQSLLVPVEGIQIASLVNGPGASGLGVDLGVTARPSDRWSVGGTFSWNDLTMDTEVISGGLILFNKGDRLNNSSEYTSSVFATYTFPLVWYMTGQLSASGNYVSKQVTRGLASGAAYAASGDNLFFSQAAFTVTFPKNWSAKLFCDNCTNEYGAFQGAIQGFASTTDNFIPRPRPRTFGLEVDYRFK